MSKANHAVPSSRKVNGKALSGDISLSAGDVGAFKLGLTGTYSVDNQVPWKADTGLYDLQRPGDSQLVAHFYNGSGSCPAFQLRVVYRNGGIAYRSARDSYGFEEDWTNIYTTKNKPSAADVGACRAYSGSINTGGGTWTTQEFIAWLKQNGAFDVPYWMCKGSWSYAGNRIINDTGCGNICLAGAVVEVMGVESAMTIRVTTPTTTANDGIPNAQFTYINHGKDYRPGWRRDYNAKPDANGNLRVSSPVVDIHPDGTYELTSEAEGVTVTRIETGKYRISGCNGFAKDGAWGIHGGTIVPADSNGLNLIWVNEYVDTSSGDITIECYHRQNTDAPKFAQNKRVKSITATGEVVYYNDGELCDIPDGRVINVRVQMPASDDEKAATVPVPSDDDPASPSA